MSDVTEDGLIDLARAAVSSCNWTVGECAAQWTQRYARGRTDSDFGQLIGLSDDATWKARRVWETFADVRPTYPQLRWSHFYAALTWDDAAECLAWAQDNEATVAEMKAWRRMQHGENLLEDAEDEQSSGAAEVPHGCGTSPSAARRPASDFEAADHAAIGQPAESEPAPTVAAQRDRQGNDDGAVTAIDEPAPAREPAPASFRDPDRTGSRDRLFGHITRAVESAQRATSPESWPALLAHLDQLRAAMATAIREAAHHMKHGA